MDTEDELFRQWLIGDREVVGRRMSVQFAVTHEVPEGVDIKERLYEDMAKALVHYPAFRNGQGFSVRDIEFKVEPPSSRMFGFTIHRLQLYVTPTISDNEKHEQLINMVKFHYERARKEAARATLLALEYATAVEIVQEKQRKLWRGAEKFTDGGGI